MTIMLIYPCCFKLDVSAKELDCGWMKNYSRGIFYEENERVRSMFTCPKCYKCFRRRARYENHVNNCFGYGEEKVNYPAFKLKSYLDVLHKKQIMPFFFTYDFETVCDPEDMYPMSYAVTCVLSPEVNQALLKNGIYLGDITWFRSYNMTKGQLMQWILPQAFPAYMKDEENRLLEYKVEQVTKFVRHSLESLLFYELTYIRKLMLRYLKNILVLQNENLSQLEINNYTTHHVYDDKNVVECVICRTSNRQIYHHFNERIKLFFGHKKRSMPDDRFIKFCLESEKMVRCYENGSSQFTFTDNDKEQSITFAEFLYGNEDRQQAFVIEAILIELLMRMEIIDNVEHSELLRNPNSIITDIANTLTDVLVVDHCHYSRKIFGYAHKRCNSKRSTRFFDLTIPVFAHNACRFDNKYIVSGIDRLLLQKDELCIIGQSVDNHSYIKAGNLFFLDSLKFLPSSLDDLSSSKTVQEQQRQNESMYSFLEHHPYFGQRPVTKYLVENLLQKKTTFPYEYIKDHTQLKQTFFPSKDTFVSALHGGTLVQDDMYELCAEIYRTTQCRDLHDLLEIYNVGDVLNLATIILHRFDELAKINDGLNPLFYTSMSMYSKDCSLFHTKSQVQVTPSRDIFEIQEAVMHGGFAATPNRLGIATRYFPKISFEDDDSRYYSTIIKCDANNLYGHAMTKTMPVGGYSLVTDLSPHFDFEKLMHTKSDDIGYVFQVDASLPEEYHDTAECLLGSLFEYEKTDIMEMGAYQILELRKPKKADANDFKLFKSEYKNHNTLKNKVGVWIFDITAQYAISKGWNIKFLRYVSFYQKPFLKDYIERNTVMRQDAQKNKQKVRSNLFKFMNNTLYGAHTMNEKGRVKLDVMTDDYRDINRAEHISNSHNVDQKNLNTPSVSIDERMKLVLNKYEDLMTSLDPDQEDYAVKIVQYQIEQAVEIQNVKEQMEKLKRSKKTVKPLKTFEEQLEDKRCSPYTRNIQVVDGISINGVSAEKMSTRTVKNSRMVGARILAEAKIDILQQAHKMFSLFEGKELLQGMKEVHPYLILTDTDSLCIMYVSRFEKSEDNPSNAAVDDFIKRRLLTDLNETFDTSNLDQWFNGSFVDMSRMKQLGYYQIENVDKPIKIMLAVNPKEYAITCEGEEFEKRHKGVKHTAPVTWQSYARKVHPFYQRVLAPEETKRLYQSTFTKRNNIMKRIEQMKLEIAKINDKQYIFNDGLSRSSLWS